MKAHVDNDIFFTSLMVVSRDVKHFDKKRLKNARHLLETDYDELEKSRYCVFCGTVFDSIMSEFGYYKCNGIYPTRESFRLQYKYSEFAYDDYISKYNSDNFSGTRLRIEEYYKMTPDRGSQYQFMYNEQRMHLPKLRLKYNLTQFETQINNDSIVLPFDIFMETKSFKSGDFPLGAIKSFQIHVTSCDKSKSKNRSDVNVVEIKKVEMLIDNTQVYVFSSKKMNTDNLTSTFLVKDSDVRNCKKDKKLKQLTIDMKYQEVLQRVQVSTIKNTIDEYLLDFTKSKIEIYTTRCANFR